MTTFMSNYKGSLMFTSFSNGSELQDELFSFLSLPDGWNYGRGVAPRYPTVVVADLLSAALYGSGAQTVEAVPESNGGVTLHARAGKWSLEVCVNASLLVDFVVDKNDIEVASDLRKPISVFIQLLRENEWLSSDLCTPDTTSNQRDAFPRLRSATPTAPARQYCVNLASAA